VPPNLRRICNFQISLSPREIRLVFVAALDENVKTIRALALSLTKKKKKGKEKRKGKRRKTGTLLRDENLVRAIFRRKRRQPNNIAR